MLYSNTQIGTFLARPNRFLAHVEVNGICVVCHVKNTGRLKELLIPGTPVLIQHHPDAALTGRKTQFSLIAVAKPLHSQTGAKKQTYTWVNIDSQAPNQAAYEWLINGTNLPFDSKPHHVRREVRYGNSRFDLAFMVGDTPWFMEVKGVTLDIDHIAKFPDAPTERGIKHLEELKHAVDDGFQTAVLFVIQMKGISAFAPNEKTHAAFAETLANVHTGGVHVWAYDCLVTEDSMQIDLPIEVRL